jgi:hypothetical protein
MAVTILMIPSQAKANPSVDSRKTIVEGQLLPRDSANAILLITSFSITSNVVTFKCVNSLTGGGGDAVLVAGFEGSLAYLNGGYTTAAATASQFTASLTHANVASTNAKALATLSPNYATGGLALGNFTGLNGMTIPMATIGPKSNPTWFAAVSVLGARQYPVNISVQPLKILNYSLAGTQATNAAAVPADSLGFRAEYEKNAY